MWASPRAYQEPSLQDTWQIAASSLPRRQVLGPREVLPEDAGRLPPGFGSTIRTQTKQTYGSDGKCPSPDERPCSSGHVQSRWRPAPLRHRPTVYRPGAAGESGCARGACERAAPPAYGRRAVCSRGHFGSAEKASINSSTRGQAL